MKNNICCETGIVTANRQMQKTLTIFQYYIDFTTVHSGCSNGFRVAMRCKVHKSII